jgi:hypothetical protein
MEDVLDLYEQSYDPLWPLVCYDEWRRALIGETRTSLPAEPGRRMRVDYEYRRNGVAYLNMLFEPLACKRYAEVTSQHTMKDFARCMKWLVDDIYPQAMIIRIVLDHLSTHKPAALYVTFPPDEARRILRKLEFHYTPKHGSWLNMAEIELSVFGRTMKNFIPEEQTSELKPKLWRWNVTLRMPGLIGSSVLPMPVSNSNNFIHPFHRD